MAEEFKDLVSNRKAFFQYEILDTYETGIALLGTEIKSLRAHGGSLQEAYVKVNGGEMWLVNCTIAPYRFGNLNNHEERRERKLLMHKYEIEKIRRDVQEKGLTLVPIAFYLKKGRVKVRIALARGKKSEDKRAAIKERDDKRTMQRVIRRGGED
ncbi:MAG: SsrA-binding protein SmpB [Chlamydiales bacterium]|nr:SsrA-binding protein SmpB [Chlamydiales bacterium]